MPTGKSWFQRLWSEDRRRANRQTELPLSAYYWDGSVPVPRQVRDISREGMYLLTEQRWYPNTLVTMTLVRSDKPEGDPERSIAMTTRVVRSGTDGVGLAFVMSPTARTGNAEESFSLGADRKTLTGFLARLQADTGRVILKLVSAVLLIVQFTASMDSVQGIASGGKVVVGRNMSLSARLL